MGTEVELDEASSVLAELVARVLGGESITICRWGTPVVDVVAHRGRQVRFGVGRGAFRCSPDAFDGEDPEVDRLFLGPLGSAP